MGILKGAREKQDCGNVETASIFDIDSLTEVNGMTD